MKKTALFSFLLVLICANLSLNAQPNTQTRMMTQPAISNSKIAFVFANDLWTAGIDGSNPVRLTIDEGIESNPCFSPDGKLIAFSAQYEGNVDVYVVSSEGGIPKRLTYHPDADIAKGFTNDGKKVIFTSGRKDFSGRLMKAFTVSLDGGFPTEIPLQSASWIAYSPDASKIAYNPLRDAFRQWKNYRGGTVSEVWLYDVKSKKVEKIPQPKTFCNDVEPQWIGDMLYFISDRNGEFNLYSFNSINKEIKQLTFFDDFPIQYISAGNGKIIFEQAAYLYIYSPETNKYDKINLNIKTDLLEVRTKIVKGMGYINSAFLSPSGARAVIECRGDIFTVPGDKGDPRNLTNSSKANDRFGTWSPDGNTIAYFSDKSGDYKLYLLPQNKKGEEKELALGGAGFYSNPVWSPDSKKICYVDNSSSIYYIDVESGKVKKIHSNIVYDVFGSLKGNWSPDSKWITYSKLQKTYIQQVMLYSLEKDKSFEVTDGLSDVTDPVFDKSGKYLYFFGSTNAGPVKEWFDQSNIDMKMTQNLYLAVLSKDSSSPFVRESDEEKGTPPAAEAKDEKSKDKDKKDKDTKKGKDEADTKKEEAKTIIDLENINYRILAFPIPSGTYWNLQVGKEGEIYYLSGDDNPGAAGGKLHFYDLKKKKDEIVSPAVNDYEISFDKSKILYASAGAWYINTLAPKLDQSQGKLKLETIDVTVEPKTEWKQIYDEVWRINRDYFYDPNMHGADWKAMYNKYLPFLDQLTNRGDLNRVIMWLCSELGVGHSYSGGGDLKSNNLYIAGGLLGADYSLENGRYRIKKIYGGLNWTPNLKSPLTEPGVNVNVNDYIISVNGKELKSDEEIYKFFVNTAGKITELSVSANPDGKDARTVKVVPIGNEYALRHYDWVEGNIKKVNEATNGQVAYVYVPDTHLGGHTFFKRYFFPQTEKKAIIVDERFNGGGLIADYVIDILKRNYQASQTTRYGESTKLPGAAILGPKVMLIDENAGSGGDMMPWMFRKNKIGTLIGKRTWGGLVGILGFPGLVDRGFVTAPNTGLWAENGWICENEGVAPDIEVEQLPADVEAGKDPQLEKAISVIMEQLKANPPYEPKQPPFPVKVKKK